MLPCGYLEQELGKGLLTARGRGWVFGESCLTGAPALGRERQAMHVTWKKPRPCGPLSLPSPCDARCGPNTTRRRQETVTQPLWPAFPDTEDGEGGERVWKGTRTVPSTRRLESCLLIPILPPCVSSTYLNISCSS